MPTLPQNPGTGTTRNPQLFVLRLLWISLLMGQWMFLGVIFLTFQQSPATPPIPTGDLLMMVAWGLLISAVTAGFVVRYIIFAKGRIDGLQAGSYFTGTLIFLACCEGASFFSLVNVMLTRSFWPAILPSVIAMALQLINFPTGRPLQPPVFADQGRA